MQPSCGIDACCSSDQSLHQHCRAAGAAPKKVLLPKRGRLGVPTASRQCTTKCAAWPLDTTPWTLVGSATKGDGKREGSELRLLPRNEGGAHVPPTDKSTPAGERRLEKKKEKKSSAKLQGRPHLKLRASTRQKTQDGALATRKSNLTQCVLKTQTPCEGRPLKLTVISPMWDHASHQR